MIFNHYTEIKNGFYYLDAVTAAKSNAVLDKDVLKELWKGFSMHCLELILQHTDDLVFVAGDPRHIELCGFPYAINIDENGIFLTASDKKNLIYGFLTLIECIAGDNDGRAKIGCGVIREKPVISNRMIHYCVFPDTELWELQRFVRFCAVLKYTHIVIEFWGMLKYDCCAELSWNHAFSKEQIQPVVKEAECLGIEIVPMFNHWGHASQSRAMHGKHVVLDQNPKLHNLFSDDGWRWNTGNPKTRGLLKLVRNELAELFPKSGYFHIGCDEAYGFKYTKAEMDGICSFVNRISDEFARDGKRVIMWADMLLYNDENYSKRNVYSAAATKEGAKYMMRNLSKEIVCADWQYDCTEYPIETSLTLKDAHFDTLLCPWDRTPQNTGACIKTAYEHGLYGIMQTTWHTLSSGSMAHVVKTAAECFGNQPCLNITPYLTKAAEILRKVYFADGNYRKAGWSRHEVSDIC